MLFNQFRFCFKKQIPVSFGFFPIGFALIICFAATGLHAQEPASAFGIETNFFGGSIFKHTPKFTTPIPSFSCAGEVNFVWKACGKRDWQKRRHCPQTGIGITYTNYGSNDILGQNVGIYPNIEFPLVSAPKFEWTFRVGMGLGIITRRYSRTEPYMDTLNVAIGSRINNFTLFTTNARYSLNDHWDIQAGVNLSHVSNAAFRKPNLGINMVGVLVGFRYFPVGSHPSKDTTKPARLRDRLLLQLRTGIAMNSAGTGNGPLFPIYSGALYVSKRMKGKNKYYIGLDYSFHENIYAFLRNNEIYPGEERKHSWKSTIFGGVEFLYGRAGLVVQVGTYLKEAHLKLGTIYQRLGMNWYLIQKETGAIKELFIATHLKTHMTQAEYAELGVGIGL